VTGNMIGRTFNNRYKIIDRIGIGGMAEVYRAQDTVLGRVVAVKTMLPQYAADPNFTQRFRQEAAAAANLQSPYIVNVYDWGQDEGTYYIVMEYVRGSDLKTAINERGAINQRKVAEIGSQVCQALTAAHKMDIIHRDIKPQNIMVQPDGNVKVMDFGIARAKNTVMAQTSAVLGTAHYISPEQAQGKDLTQASDIYSLGIVLYEAATGKLPFDAPDAVSVAMKQVNEPPAPPSTINPDIDPSLENIIMRALSKNPMDRFATATDMRQSLSDYLSGRPVSFGQGFAGAETAVLGSAAASGIADGTAVMPNVGNNGNGQAVSTNYLDKDSGKKKMSNKKIAGIVIGAVAAVLAIVGIVFALTSNAGEGDAVPDVTGVSVEVATQKLTDAGFELGRQDTAHSDTVSEGKIISQDPSANSKAEKGTKVNVVVSSGKEKITVPDLTGMTADQAKQALDKVGLKASAGTAEYSGDIEVNHVIRQNPAANTEASKGDTITYILSLGVENGDVPNVVGMGVNDAIATLENAGFKVNQVRGGYSDKYAVDSVMSQNPSSGTKTPKGSTVTINLSDGPEPEPDPTVQNVVGSTIADAKATLEAAGFKVSYPSGTDTKLKVASQSPAGNTTAAKGSTVTLTPETPPANNTNSGS
jgi:beta-lactam-binding protein with PASTA domain/predicted Ser/Thr protein kinase